jgi:hypothetical protein
VVSLQQIHSQRVLWCDEAEGGDCKGDGLLTMEPGVVPAVTVADCMPIYLFAAGTPLRGLVHSGWKGTGIVLRALERAAERLQLPPACVTVVLGPAIGPCCYRVDEERARSFAGCWGPESVRYRDGAPYLDLYTANRRALERAGVEEIREVRECTVCGEGFGSFRREGPQSFTHMLAMIADFPVD